MSVTTINPTHVSPILISEIVIQGSSFGNNRKDINVYLVEENNETERYILDIKSVKDIEIKAIFSGGHVDKYRIKVVHNVYGKFISKIYLNVDIIVNEIS